MALKFTAAALALAAFIAAAAPGDAAETLPSGWRLDGDELVWTSEAPLRMGGARYEFRSGDRLLGYPKQVGNTLRLRRSPADPLTKLSVWAAASSPRRCCAASADRSR